MLGNHDKVLNVPMLGDQTFMAITSVTQAQSYSIHSGHLTFTCLQISDFYILSIEIFEL